MKPHNNNWNNDRSFERLVTQRKQVFLLTDCKTLQVQKKLTGCGPVSVVLEMQRNFKIRCIKTTILGKLEMLLKLSKRSWVANTPILKFMLSCVGVQFPQRAQVVQSNHLSSRPSRIGLVMYQTGSRPHLDMKRLISKKRLRLSLNLELMHLHGL